MALYTTKSPKASTLISIDYIYNHPILVLESIILNIFVKEAHEY